MRTAVDTNVLSSFLSQTAYFSAISRALHAATMDGPLHISAAVYAELLAYPRITMETLDRFLVETKIEVLHRIDLPVWVEAGSRYGRYAARRRKAIGEPPRRLLADFIIGAHALAHADRLMTFDLGFFALDFPDLRLHSPLAD